MAPRKNKSKGKGKKGRKTRAPRLVKGTTQFASLTETYDLGRLMPIQALKLRLLAS